MKSVIITIALMIVALLSNYAGYLDGKASADRYYAKRPVTQAEMVSESNADLAAIIAELGGHAECWAGGADHRLSSLDLVIATKQGTVYCVRK